MSGQWFLEIAASEHGPARRVAIEPGTTIGRSSQNSMVLPDGSVSSFHARIDAGPVVSDVGSQNGVFIEGLGRIPEGKLVALKPGMRIQFARTETLVIHEATDVDGAASTVYRRRRVDPVTAPAQGPTPSPEPSPSPVPPSAPPVPSQRDPIRANSSREPGAPPAATLGPKGDTAAVRALETMGARLILLDPAQPRVVPILAATNTMGAKSAANIHIQSEAVSDHHAEIAFVASTSSFQIKDLGSANGTTLNRATLTPEVSQRVELDSVIRVGPVDAVLRADVESDGSLTPSDFDERVAARLIAKGKLKAATMKQRRKGASGPLGDALILGGDVSPSTWADAAREVRLLGPARGGGVAKAIMIFFFFVVLAVAIAVMVFREQIFGSR